MEGHGVTKAATPYGRRRPTLRATLLAGSILCGMLAPATATEFGLPRTNTGTVGLIEMPSARMAPSGTLAVGGGFFRNTQHYNLGFQALPWLEASFRYTGLENYDPLYPVYFDRSFGMKLRLWDEDPIIPALSIGIDDLIGTGIYSSEYIVASKSFGDVDATIGMGWGRLSSTDLLSNPLTILADSLETRPGLTTPGGTNFKVYFHGPKIGLFGGISWRTPLEGLTLLAEYSSDRYELENTSGNFHPNGRINIGASYRLTDNMRIGAAWLYNRTLSFNFTMEMDPTRPQFPTSISTAPLPVSVRTEQEQHEALNRLAGRPSSVTATNVKLADLLWSADDVRDVRINGRTIILSVGSTRRRCEDFATVVQMYDATIDTVEVQGAGALQRCTAASHAINVNFMQKTDLTTTAKSVLSPMVIDATMAPPRSRDSAEREIRAEAAKQNIPIEALSLTGGEALVYYTNTQYFSESEVIERLTRILMAKALPETEIFRLVAMVQGVSQRQFVILRSVVERNKFQVLEENLMAGTVQASAPMTEDPVATGQLRGSYPRFNWGISPQVRQALFDPVQPFGVQVALEASGSLEPFRGLSFNVGYDFSLYDNFNTARQSDSTLPHVRSDFVRYFAQGKNGISILDAEYRFRPAPTVFAVVKAGYLENMFAGVGGEVLWRPEGQRWALGADFYSVWQREFDRMLGLQKYNASTGHLSLYYQSPWYELNFVARAGQFLAGDRGLNLEVTRRFSTGVEVGAFMTKTNLSAANFGEGSFDKGIIIRIPLGWVAPFESQSEFGMNLRPVQRDGGQRLSGDTTLYYETRRASQAELYLTAPQMLAP